MKKREMTQHPSKVGIELKKITRVLSCSMCTVCIIIRHTYHARFIPEGVAEASQILLREVHVVPKLFSYEKYCTHDKW
jgi:hypothetical protein